MLPQDKDESLAIKLPGKTKPNTFLSKTTEARVSAIHYPQCPEQNLKIINHVKQQEGIIVKRKKVNRNRPKDNAGVKISGQVL